MSTFALLLAIAAGPTHADCAPQFAPLTTGTHAGTSSSLPYWRKAEAGKWGGDGWLGWKWDSETLQPVRLIVGDRTKDDEADDEEVSVESVPAVTFAVRCVPHVRAGRILTARLTDQSLDPKRPLTIALGRRQYELRIQSARDDLFDAQVVLTHEDRRQVLYRAGGFADEPHFDIAWAGDLDGDGQLDLVVDLNRKYSVHPYRLLLSTKASGAELVGEAATFETGD